MEHHLRKLFSTKIYILQTYIFRNKFIEFVQKILTQTSTLFQPLRLSGQVLKLLEIHA